jgi:DNA-directed RNA polymerase subunit beta'
MATTTLGRELLRSKLPERYKKYADRLWDKSTVETVLTQIAQEDPEGYVDILQGLNDLGRRVVTGYGKEASLSVKDFKQSAPILKLQASAMNAFRAIYNSDTLTHEQKEKAIHELNRKLYSKAQDIIYKDHQERNTALGSQMAAGVRGNKSQLMQLALGNIAISDASGRPVPFTFVENYSSGVSPLTYWLGANSSRKGYIDVQFATADAGYLSKQIANTTHSTAISMNDCGTTDTGIPVKANDSQNLGAVLLKPYKGFKPGTVVTKALLAEADDDDEIIVRSPITCQAKGGICAHCAGVQANGKFPGVGEYLALTAAKSFSEPLTQAAVGSKHAGSVGASDDNDLPTGFEAISQMLTLPSTFKAKAVLADKAGTITSITNAPQGGMFLRIDNNKPLYVPSTRKVTVSVGDKVSPGDVLTNGIPNPKDIVGYKGIGYGREYFIKAFSKILKDSGAGTMRRNVEAFTRAFVNKVRVTDPDGYKGYMPGDVVDYDDIISSWKPRSTAVSMAPKQAIGQYLDKPTLYFTVGTKITKEVADTLDKYNTTEVLANPEPPPWEPELVRSQAYMLNDKDWMARLTGERIQPALFDAARKGLEADYDSQSMYTKVMLTPYRS